MVWLLERNRGWAIYWVKGERLVDWTDRMEGSTNLPLQSIRSLRDTNSVVCALLANFTYLHHFSFYLTLTFNWQDCWKQWKQFQEYSIDTCFVSKNAFSKHCYHFRSKKLWFLNLYWRESSSCFFSDKIVKHLLRRLTYSFNVSNNIENLGKLA